MSIISQKFGLWPLDYTYCKASLKVFGVTKVHLRNPKNQKKYCVELVVEDYTPLLGSVSAQKMVLITAKQENTLNVTEAVDKPDFHGLSKKEINATYSDVFNPFPPMSVKWHL